jgi:hypothetical protein
MSAISNTAQAVPSRRLRLPRKLVAVALVVALAAAALTVALVASGGSGSAAPRSVAQAAPQRQYFGGPAEGRALAGERPSAPANDGSEHSGARP